MEHKVLDYKVVLSGKEFYGFYKVMGEFNQSSFVTKVFDAYKKDNYNLGVSQEVLRRNFKISTNGNYKIEGVTTFNNELKSSRVSLYTFDYVLVQTTISDSEGKYSFEFIPYNTYIIIAEDLSLIWNSTIQVGVVPIEQD